MYLLLVVTGDVIMVTMLANL